MTTGRSAAAVPYTPGLSGDVVASLVNDGRAEQIARAAADEARQRGARLCFIQVVQAGLTPEEFADADQATFRAAVRALRGFRGIPCRFEVVTGDPTPTLLELAQDASVLIIGADEGSGSDVLARCRAQASCEVIAVPGLR